MIGTPLSPDGHLVDLGGRDEPAARFMRNLSNEDLCRLANLGGAPDLATATHSEVEDWLYAIWDEEENVEDPACPVIPYRDWVAICAEDRFHDHHIHARFVIEVIEPQLDLTLGEGPSP
ncbi:hypothetical protein LAZ40_06680 [Cereibacter sphaeroides]|uniref:hypothetical protein n=1 Tax=Cereibacter sphaeroides TaxID=1063 RepID=UPI001F22FC5C|nr:hypothetical protein [Cereibacter sphaeroides]MCE6958731.1 hypothetical protein [Cereibacter sphaeroides]MCE6973395.1 hypothetical protein [Cereibacter sphaeroides]